ncbi:uncharacterized protein LOC110018520 [Phalaenopsis equestris]|uniref:uncharacterized protein LOC110018520 n=1 Tax=Phalaenopsis equestris TaxID=78828 RepID=UPI0009E5328F|nr:uncharacterized protein LOC110018520 [Phalaenopsis equestris]
MGRRNGGALSLKSLNHISHVCNCLERTVHFYQNILGFLPIKRPDSFDFEGAWLFNYGFGIHLLQSEEPNCMPQNYEINPNGNHISFQCENLAMVEKKLKEMEISYIHRRVEEWGLHVDQLFFHDPDGFLIKVCNFENLPLIPLPVGQHAMVNAFMQAGQLPPQAVIAEAAVAEEHNNAIILHSC